MLSVLSTRQRRPERHQPLLFPGAKIGVLGANGAGKSSLLKIMAGIDDGFSGEARLTPPYTVGFLPQEPELSPEKTVYENVMDGVGEVADLLARYDAVLSQWSDPDADFENWDPFSHL